MSQMTTRELTPAFGSEIIGVDLESPFDEETIRFVREVFDDRGLILFRDTALDRPQQVYVTQILRGLEPPSRQEAEEIAATQDTFNISNREPDGAAPFGRLLFHCDSMWAELPFEVLSLFAVEVEPPVLPTMLASSAHGWDTLPDDLRARVAGRSAVHVSGPEYVHERRRRAFEGELVQATRDYVPMHTMPVAYVHPRTGRTLLYVSQGMTREIEGMGSEASEDLLEQLFDHLYRPENTLEHEWRNGDIVYWDNLAVQHARPNVAIDGPARTLRKIGLPIDLSTVPEQLVDTYEPVN